MRTWNGVTSCAAAVLFAACAPAPRLVPAPGAQPSPEIRGGAAAVYAGVRMSASADRWVGEPRDLGREVTPVLVRVENDGATPVVIRYASFEFRHPDGENFEAIPPFNIDATVIEPVDVMAYPTSRFHFAPYLRRYYGFYGPFWDPFYFDRGWYVDRYTAWRRVELPTADMVRLALPEGVLEPGGVVMGFVYFEHIPHEPEQVTLYLNLVTPDGDSIGRVQIPFENR